jgi:hypothetical protein
MRPLGFRRLGRPFATFVLAVLSAVACGPRDQAGSTSASLRPSERAAAARALELPDEHYYMIVFGAQDLLDHPRATHTWATFVAAPSVAGAPATLDAVDTISWMPADLKIWLFQQPEVGVNLSLEASLELAQSVPISVRRSTTLEITPALYARAMARVAFLAGAARDGSTLYTVLDGDERDPPAQNRPGGAVNCIHAVSDLGGWLETHNHRGFAASRRVTRHLMKETIQPNVDHTWVAAALGIGATQGP